jgi:DNA invertase Pin-like site-specific DNA recombinase
MAKGKFVSYLRVSTDKQGRSGLGLEAQREPVASYLNGGRWTLVAEYVETESGKRADRPKLKAALAHSKALGATLVFAKLDRLTRNVDLLRSLVGTWCSATCPACLQGLWAASCSLRWPPWLSLRPD